MHRAAFLLILTALAPAGCAGGSDESAPEQPPAATTQPAAAAPEQPPASTAPSRLFAKKDLGRLALQPSDAPFGMRYTKAESGARTLLDVGIVLDEQVAQIRELGFRGAYDVIFDSTTIDLRLATRLWLFDKPNGAKRWLQKSRDDSILFQLEPIRAPRLAEESWAAGGAVGGSAVISHAFRAGNLVVVVSYLTQSRELSESDALAAAQKAAGRVRLASN